MFSKSRAGWGVLGLTLIAAGSAWAYIPPASFILHSIAKKHTAFTTIRIRSNIFGVDGSGNPSTPKLHETTLFNSREHHLVSWVSDDSGKVLYMTDRQGAAGKLPLIPEVLFDANSIRIMNALKTAGVTLPQTVETPQNAQTDDPDKMTLRRWNHTVAWVMGAGAGSSAPKSAQLWIEKDTFIPLRVVTPAQGDSDLFDFQMENFRNFDEYSYPKLATLYQQGKKAPLLRAELVDAVLDLEQAAAEQPKEKVEGFTDAGSSSSSSVRELIQTYYRLIR